MQLICPCRIGRKDLMTRSYPAAVGETASTLGQTKVFIAMPDTTLAPAIDPGGMMDRPGVVSRAGELKRGERPLNSAVDLSVPNWTQASDEKVLSRGGW